MEDEDGDEDDEEEEPSVSRSSALGLCKCGEETEVMGFGLWACIPLKFPIGGTDEGLDDTGGEETPRGTGSLDEVST